MKSYSILTINIKIPYVLSHRNFLLYQIFFLYLTKQEKYIFLYYRKFCLNAAKVYSSKTDVNSNCDATILRGICDSK